MRKITNLPGIILINITKTNLIPPLIGFFSKQFVLYSALQNGYYFISLIAIIVSVISASYYLKIIKVLHTFEDSKVEANKASKVSIKLKQSINTNNASLCHCHGNDQGIDAVDEPSIDNNLFPIIFTQSNPCHHYHDNGGTGYTLTNTHSFLISSLTLIILLFFIKPSIILNSTQLLSLSLFNS